MVQAYYEQNKQYGRRGETDALCAFPSRQKFHGIMDRLARFIEEYQLLEEGDWDLFVAQFRDKSDDKDRGWRGEYFGKMMRGACMTYQYTENEALYDLLTRAAKAMLETQDERGRFSTYSPDQDFRGWDLWCRKYVLLGFLHYHEICKNEALKAQIVTALSAHLDDVIAHVGPGKLDLSETTTRWLGINSASLLEPVMRMYNLTKNESYLDFARYIIDFLQTGQSQIFSLALEGKLYPYQYPVTKAYEMMSCFEGLLEYYRLTGEETWKKAVIDFADKVRESDITVIGCAGCMHELFNHSVAMQTDTEYKGIMQETCVTVTWMKLCDQLLSLTGDGKYADDIETSYYNALYGAVNTRRIEKGDDFLFDSYSPLTLGQRGRKAGGYKAISDTRYYGCCVAIGAAGTALPLLRAAMATKNGLALNFYEAGTIDTAGFALSLETAYPADGKVKITVNAAPQKEATLALRIPAFSGDRTRATLLGEALPVTVKNGYLTLSRVWKAGDTVELAFDMNPRVLRPCGVEGQEASKHFVAFLYGPLALARDAQITSVSDPIALDDAVTVTPKDKEGFDCLLRAEVTLGGESFDLIDYGSAGKSWDEASQTEVWIPTKA